MIVGSYYLDYGHPYLKQSGCWLFLEPGSVA